jgi:hypothetical protein
MAESTVNCGNCGTLINESPDTPVENRQPCPACKSLSRSFNLSLAEEVSKKEFLDIKKKSPGFPSKKKLRVHLQQGDQINQGTGKWIFKKRRIDKDKSPAWYLESIVDLETGKEIHRDDGPLDRHTGHGSAKKK